MIRVNLFEFYELGSHLGRLDAVREGVEAGTLFGELHHARVHLNRVLASKVIPLGTSRRAGEKLQAAIDALFKPLLASIMRETAAHAVDWSEANAVVIARQEFETVLAAEMPGLAMFFVQKKAIFDTVELVDRADCIFSPEILERMPSEARKDICEAGRCLAFELYTATGFHIFRAMESVIIIYYHSLKKAPALKDTDRNWGRYIDGLKAGGADPKITDYLTYFKNAHRNPVTHPETVLTKDEAIALFHALPNAIVPIINALPKKKVKKPKPPVILTPPPAPAASLPPAP
jgi:hypothetical protein